MELGLFLFSLQKLQLHIIIKNLIREIGNQEWKFVISSLFIEIFETKNRKTS